MLLRSEIMICKNCGFEISDDSVLCPQCGAPVASETAQTDPEVRVAFDQPEEPVKKSKKGLVVGLSAAVALVVAIAIVIGVMWPRLEGAWVENFGTNEEYLAYVQQNSSGSTIGTLPEAYRDLLSMMSGSTSAANGGIKASVKLNVGQKAIGMLESSLQQAAGQTIEMDWLDGICLDMQAHIQDKMEKVTSSLMIGKTEIVKLDSIINGDKGEVFLGILSFSDKYLKIDLNEMKDSITVPPGDMGATASSGMSNLLELLTDKDLLAALPDEKVATQLEDKYVGILLDNLQNVEKTTETVKIGELSQDLTLLKTTITPEDGIRISAAVMNALKEDKQVEKIIKDIEKVLKDSKRIDADYDSYKAFVDAIDDALASMNDEELEAEETPIVWTEYVNSSHKVVGRRVQMENEEMYFCRLQQGDQSAMELNYGGVHITGGATTKNGVINSDYIVSVADSDLFRFSEIDFRDSDKPKGTVRITPSADFIKGLGKGLGMDEVEASALVLANPKIEVNIDTGKNSGTTEINILAGGEVLVGVTVFYEQINAENISEPQNALSTEQAEAWLSGMDINKLMEKLQEAGVPVEVFMELFQEPEFH